MPYIKPKTVSGTPSTYTKVDNSAGFNRTTTGNDTRPGPEAGAPLMNTRTVDDGPIKGIRYPTGVSPYSLDVGNTTAPEFVRNGKQSLPIDSPVPMKDRQMPDPDTHGKASAENAAEMKIGSDPKGVLSR